VPRALSAVNATMAKSVTTASPSTNATVSNPSGPIAGNADFYAWGLSDANAKGTSSADVRAIGVQAFPFPSGAEPGRRLMVFAVNTWNRWSNPSTNEFDIYVDVNGDGVDDYVVVGADGSAFGRAEGTMAAGVFPINPSASGTLSPFAVTAPSDGSTAELPVLSSQFCAPAHPCMRTFGAPNKRFTYHAVAFDGLTGFVDVVGGLAKFNAATSAISQGDFVTVPAGASGAVPVTVNPAEWAQTPALGTMIITLDNKAGAGEATLLPLQLKP
jgi:minor extracellular serine protease Vpr